MSDLVLNTFGLRRHPFTVDIDVDGLYAFQSFQQGALRLEQAARQKGSILVVAEPGTGKTALLRSVVKRLASSSFSVFEQLVPAVQSPVRAAVEGLLTQLGEPLPFNNTARALARLKQAMLVVAEKQRTPVLILDDVHHLSTNCWLTLKTLMNYDMDSKMPLLLVFLGGPKTLRQLNFNALEEVRDRLSSCFYLKGLQAKEVEPYLEHRLKWAGAKRALFPEDVAEELGRHAQGNPRRVNRLASICLLAAASQNRKLVDRECLEAAVSEVQFQQPAREEE